MLLGKEEVHARNECTIDIAILWPVDQIKNRAELFRCPSSARLFASPAGQRRSGTRAGTLKVAPLMRPMAATNRWMASMFKMAASRREAIRCHRSEEGSGH